jgi:hypothetical protein
MSTVELRELVASLVLSQKETDLQIKVTGVQMKETDERIKEAAVEIKETAQLLKETRNQIKELGKQIGGLGNKFGSFAEGLAYRSIVRILKGKFGMNDFVAPGVRVRRNGLQEEYDILAYSNGSLDQGMIVEIKSNLRKEDIVQMQRKMDGVFKLMPEHRDKTFQGMIACVSGAEDLKQQVLENGWYLAHIGDNLFELETPQNFVAKSYAF